MIIGKISLRVRDGFMVGNGVMVKIILGEFKNGMVIDIS
jgi:hypothetical protein